MTMNREELKRRARAQLGGNIFGSRWLYAVVVELVLFLGLGTAIRLGGNMSRSTLSIGLGLLLGGPLEYAAGYLFLKQSRDDQPMDLKELLKGFREDFGGLFLLNLMRSLFVALWSLLFVIPGIIAEYSYAMSFFIRVDHPEYDWNTCLRESKRMMEGHKMDYFVLELSFLGWRIVGALCLGVGTLWVNSYIRATQAQFYEQLCCQERFYSEETV